MPKEYPIIVMLAIPDGKGGHTCPDCGKGSVFVLSEEQLQDVEYIGRVLKKAVEKL